MKKSLKELELNIPTIDVLESRKITGGYEVDDGWWHGSPGEEDNPYELPEVVVTPGEQPDSGYDPREDDSQEQDDPDGDRNEDGRGDDNGDGKGDDKGRNEPTVQVPNGDCLPGAIAAIVQILGGGSASDALDRANGILDKVGAKDGEGGKGTEITGPQMVEVMTELTGEGTFNPDRSQWEGMFDSGSVALGFMEGGDHAVVVTDYDPTTGMFEYFDATDDHYGWHNGAAGEFTYIVFGK